jgi:hypothetical protein
MANLLAFKEALQQAAATQHGDDDDKAKNKATAAGGDAAKGKAGVEASKHGHGTLLADDRTTKAHDAIKDKAKPRHRSA